MDYIGKYEEQVYPKERVIASDIFDLGMKRHYVSGLAEVDVTEARRILSEQAASGEEKLSFTGWVTKCIAQAVSEHKIVHAMRHGKKHLIVFDDIDVSVLLETNFKDGTIPKPLIVRRAQDKTVSQITNEIRAAQRQKLSDSWEQLGEGSGERIARLARIFPSLPKVFRRIVYRKWKDPFFVKKNLGTVLVSSVGMFARMGGWGLPIGTHPLVFILGGIGRKPGVVEDRIEIRDMLSVTMMFNHDVVDGAPVVRFGQRLADLVQSAFGLR
ncbi:MAG: 2-oxo acid dehydrogenase subunit E2 [Candidatus Thorarchaeota archaeon]|nr:2-oxo acid dehydrogenase subunit E2 [Candidatus Thorarchaeota archaeon]